MKVFLTEKDGKAGERIEAFDLGHAKQLAWSEPGLEVIGEHVLTIQRDGFNENDADRMCKALSESHH